MNSYSQRVFEEQSVVEFTPLDELFDLKRKLVVGGKLSENNRLLSKRILEILVENPGYATELVEWRFLECELLFVLRSGYFRVGVQIATLVIRETKRIPTFYLSKAFLFFLSNKLAKTTDFSGSGKIKSEIILTFATELIKVNREVARSLLTAGFFILAAALVTPEASKLYSSVFDGIMSLNGTSRGKDEGPTASNSVPSVPGSVYEVHRKFFDPEIILYEQDILNLKELKIRYRNGFFIEIYNGCANMYHLIEQDTANMLDVMLYKRMTYINDNVLLLISEKNPKAVAYYRRALEAGLVCDNSLLPALVQMLDAKETRMDAAISLYYHINSETLVSKRFFTSLRIKAIFQCLEYKCEPECKKRTTQGEFTDYDDIVSFSESECPDESIPALSTANNQDITPEKYNYCNRIRILCLIKQLYAHLPNELFYTPSHLILIRSCMAHCNLELPFIRTYFREFLKYISSNRLNIARVLFPEFKSKKPIQSHVEIKLDEGDNPVEAENGDYIDSDELNALFENMTEGANSRTRRVIDTDE